MLATLATLAFLFGVGGLGGAPTVTKPARVADGASLNGGVDGILASAPRPSPFSAPGRAPPLEAPGARPAPLPPAAAPQQQQLARLAAGGASAVAAPQGARCVGCCHAVLSRSAPQHSAS